MNIRQSASLFDSRNVRRPIESPETRQWPRLTVVQLALIRYLDKSLPYRFILYFKVPPHLRLRLEELFAGNDVDPPFERFAQEGEEVGEAAHVVQQVYLLGGGQHQRPAGGGGEDDDILQTHSDIVETTLRGSQKAYHGRESK